MTLFDYAVLAILGLSMAISVVRGVVREVLALAAWVVAFLAANAFGGTVGRWLPRMMPNDELQLLLGVALVFFVALLVMSLVALAVSRLVKNAGLGLEDRMLGALFGFARGAFVVLLLVLAAGFTALPRGPVWRNAMLSPPLEAIAAYVKAWLPTEISQRIKYD